MQCGRTSGACHANEMKCYALLIAMSAVMMPPLVLMSMPLIKWPGMHPPSDAATAVIRIQAADDASLPETVARSVPGFVLVTVALAPRMRRSSAIDEFSMMVFSILRGCRPLLV